MYNRLYGFIEKKIYNNKEFIYSLQLGFWQKIQLLVQRNSQLLFI